MDELKAKEFIEEIISVCKKHNLSLGHEDIGGVFEVHPYDKRKTEWLKDYTIGDCSRFSVSHRVYAKYPPD